MSVNIPLLRKVMEHITTHPEEYDQREYAVRSDCGTSHCIAGWALALSGREFTYRRLQSWDHRTAADFGWAAQVGILGDCSEHDEAAKALGLEDDDAAEMFHEDQTLSGVWECVERVTDGEIARPIS